MGWYMMAFRKLGVTDGRASRREYWGFTLVNIAVAVTLTIASIAWLEDSSLPLILLGAYLIVTFVPALALTVRRLHDTGRSGLWWLVALIPYVGAVVLLVLMAFPSDAGANEYGPNPNESASAIGGAAGAARPHSTAGATSD